MIHRNNVPIIGNWVNGIEKCNSNANLIEKFDPNNGELLCCIEDASQMDVEYAIEIAKKGFELWSSFTPVKRGQILGNIVLEMNK